MTHNIKVSIFTLALGMTWGIGTLIMLFYNGVILGAVALDYVLAGETTFLLGWLLPHFGRGPDRVGQAHFIEAKAQKNCRGPGDANIRNRGDADLGRYH